MPLPLVDRPWLLSAGCGDVCMYGWVRGKHVKKVINVLWLGELIVAALGAFRFYAWGTRPNGGNG